MMGGSSPSFLYAPPSPFELAAAAVTALVLGVLALFEFRGDNMSYSKFCRVRAATVPSLGGMLLAYGPALAAALASLAVPGVGMDGERPRALGAALAAHFLKRVLEVLFVHRYSGRMGLASALLISGYYLCNVVVGMVYVQCISRDLPDPAVDLLYPGVLAVAVGLAGNLYHHLLLSRLRAGDEGSKGSYQVPRGGLFGLVACPHYLFEILAFFGFAMVSQTFYALVVAVGTAGYLGGRSYATRKWYASKFEEYPANIKNLVPYVW